MAMSIKLGNNPFACDLRSCFSVYETLQIAGSTCATPAERLRVGAIETHVVLNCSKYIMEYIVEFYALALIIGFIYIYI